MANCKLLLGTSRLLISKSTFPLKIEDFQVKIDLLSVIVEKNQMKEGKQD